MTKKTLLFAVVALCLGATALIGCGSSDDSGATGMDQVKKQSQGQAPVDNGVVGQDKVAPEGGLPMPPGKHSGG